MESNREVVRLTRRRRGLSFLREVWEHVFHENLIIEPFVLDFDQLYPSMRQKNTDPENEPRENTLD